MLPQIAQISKHRLVSLVIASTILSACSLTAPDPTGAEGAHDASVNTTDTETRLGLQESETNQSALLPSLSVEPVASLAGSAGQTAESAPEARLVAARDFAPINPAKLAFIWYDLPLLGLNNFVPTYVQLSKDGPTTLLSFVLPPANILCEGRISFNPNDPPHFNTGDWEIGCSNSQVLRGILVPVTGQNAINGQGTDLDGRSVIFSIDMNG